MRCLLALLLAVPLVAQHDMSQMHDMAGMDMKSMSPAETMEASGTSRNPESSPMAMIHLKTGRWSLMFHGVAFITDILETGARGHDKFTSVSWGMGEAEHTLAGGTFSVRTMLSLDPATVTGRQYPELFQTGETAFGKAIVDGQHPHNLFMEAAVHYTHPLGARSSWEVYMAPVGDPALGPVAFPHRVSAEELPQATLGHHLEDSTHVSYDVVTVGATTGIFHLEASGFHGAEPGENRWTIGYGAVDSWAGRLAVAPAANWSGQISLGHLTHPEALEAGDQNRVTASVTYNRPIHIANWGGNWATGAIWGRVHKLADKSNLDGYTVESVAHFAAKNAVTARVEIVDKDELPLPGLYRVGAWTAGYTRDFNLFPRLATGLGFNLTAYDIPAALHVLYGQHPVSALVFLRIKVRDAS